MNALTAFGLLGALLVGGLLGWLVRGIRGGERLARAEAALAALQDNERLLQRSLSMANEDSARRHSGAIGSQVAALVDPLRDAIGALGQHVSQLEANRLHAYAGLREQVAGMQRTSHQLSTQTAQLVSALRAPAVRGRWGEVQLERVVELAGMAKHCDFATQVTRGSVRPDLVVHLAGGRHIIVDAKVPLEAYLDATAEEDRGSQDMLLARHARQLRHHVDQLAAKSYWESFEQSPEFVVLFLPGDPFLDAALTSDAHLLEYAFAKNVIMATPTTLVALLRTVAYSWRQESISRDVATIQQLGRELYNRLNTAGQHLDRLGSQLGKAVDSFNMTASSIESRVMVTARKLAELQDHESGVSDIRHVDSWPRGVRLAPTAVQE
ncbi:DNA recombination protein RmuC [Skermania sp. ID1734]|uniref:DNA recombination protein RmuC n=1 Tax=Skermania sp. ID1734 TaxID=2597516 RepID=UPI00117FEEB8|nr:DNA recombination protein RmuC [Skermania sp. ID1734]TSE02218.1 DNA recombination protein RmuC [Skermania sp. ID1734]